MVRHCQIENGQMKNGQSSLHLFPMYIPTANDYLTPHQANSIHLKPKPIRLCVCISVCLYPLSGGLYEYISLNFILLGVWQGRKMKWANKCQKTRFFRFLYLNWSDNFILSSIFTCMSNITGYFIFCFGLRFHC